MAETNKIFSKGNAFKKIRSKFILKRLLENLPTNVLLEVLRYNKRIKKIINKDIDDYKKYLQIIIHIIPIENEFGNFINISNNNERHYYHIYFNDNENEIQRKYITEEDNVTKIKIAIDYEIKNLYGLFRDCKCIKIMNFIKFNRKVNEDMSYLFSRYSSIEEINFCNFKTDNVTNMSYMFYECSSLKNINLDKFNTINVTNMRGMFYGCKSLIEINLKKLDITKVIDMSDMFEGCDPLNIECSDVFKDKIRSFGFERAFWKKPFSFALYYYYSPFMTANNSLMESFE